MRALIVGGGVAGPVLGLALSRVGIEAELYERSAGDGSESGALLTLAPNGLNALRAVGADGGVAEQGFASTGIEFRSRGRRIGALDSRGERDRYGAQTLMVSRAGLLSVLRDEAARRGVRITFGKRLDRYELVAGGVTALFGDGTSADGDVLLGCDGLHSRTRAQLLPDGPQPHPTGRIGLGGFAPVGLARSGGQVVTFGRHTVFGHFVDPSGVAWWSSTAADAEVPGNTGPAHLLDLHADEPAPIPQILRAEGLSVSAWPSHDLPPLPTWHDQRVCLVGDAAHAVPWEGGQGASLAIEDAVVLAGCLRDAPGPEQAFGYFERLRRPRVVEKLAVWSRRAARALPGPLAGRLRDLLLPALLRAGAAATGGGARVPRRGRRGDRGLESSPQSLNRTDDPCR